MHAGGFGLSEKTKKILQGLSVKTIANNNSTILPPKGSKNNSGQVEFTSPRRTKTQKLTKLCSLLFTMVPPKGLYPPFQNRPSWFKRPDGQIEKDEQGENTNGIKRKEIRYQERNTAMLNTASFGPTENCKSAENYATSPHLFNEH